MNLHSVSHSCTIETGAIVAEEFCNFLRVPVPGNPSHCIQGHHYTQVVPVSVSHSVSSCVPQSILLGDHTRFIIICVFVSACFIALATSISVTVEITFPAVV